MEFWKEVRRQVLTNELSRGVARAAIASCGAPSPPNRHKIAPAIAASTAVPGSAFVLTVAVPEVLEAAVGTVLAETKFVWTAVVACELPVSCTPSARPGVLLTSDVATVAAAVATPLTAKVNWVFALPPSFS
jgi:hypothetical protein